ncbi:MAG: helix-turn-helix transcriptional regulator [Armatimonadetes bacterium]|nr:helix-turn-helix transcriptional regulator [Armatimonadota bacterium]
MKPFREALGELVQESGLQQLDIAVRAGISEGSVSLYLTGKRYPRPPTMARLAQVFGLAPEYFKEYREWKAKHLIEQAMAEGLIELEDIELILAAKRYQQSSRRE